MIAVLRENVLSNEEPESTLGERICNARQAAGLTLNLASHLAGVKVSTLRDWRRDRSEPRLKTCGFSMYFRSCSNPFIG